MSVNSKTVLTTDKALGPLPVGTSMSVNIRMANGTNRVSSPMTMEMKKYDVH